MTAWPTRTPSLASFLTLTLIVGLGWSAPALASSDAAAEAAVEKGAALEQQVIGETGATAVEPITPDEATALDPDGAAPVDEALVCLARTVYWEAKGEGVAGMEAVASVVINRLAAEGFPATLCAVVMDGQEKATCQFGWWCDGKSDTATEPEQYAMALDVARRALNQELDDRTEGALYFAAGGSRPEWTSSMVETLAVGDHVFFRPEPSTE